MRTFVAGALIATLALTGTALAFGPGSGRGQGFWSQTGQQPNLQCTNSNDQQACIQMQNRGQGMGFGQGRNNQGRGMQQGMGWQQNQPNQQNGTQQFVNRGNRTGEPVFVDSYDENGDRVVSLAEATARRADLFSALDDNEDGVVNASEFNQFLTDTKMAPEDATNGQYGLNGMTFSFNDANKDGRVDKAEFLAQTANWLKLMDRDGDGKVSDSDFGPGSNQMGRGQGRGNGMGRGQGGRWTQQQG